MDQNGDGLQRRYSVPVLSDGGIDKPGRIVDIIFLIGTNNLSRSSDTEEAQREPMLVCLFTTLWQKFLCEVLTVCTIPMSTRSLSSTGRSQMESNCAKSGKSQRRTNDIDGLRAWELWIRA